MGMHSYIAPRTIPKQYPLRDEINRMIDCIKAANYSTIESTPEAAGYSGERSEGGKNAVAIHVVEYAPAEERVLLGLIRKKTQTMKTICVIRYEDSFWKIHNTEIFSTEKLSALFRHLRYYNMDIHLEGVPDELLNKVYVEARIARPGATDRLT